MLKANNKELDLVDDSFTFDYVVKDVNNLDLTKPTTSTSIQLPGTAINKKEFGFIEEPQIEIPPYFEDVFYSEGGFTIRGKLKLYEAETLNENVNYRTQIIAGSGDWISDIQNKKVNELDYSSDNHVLNKANLDTSETFAPYLSIEGDTNFLTRRNYIYPVISYGKLLDGKNWNIIERYPAINLRSIVEKIYNDIGYTIQGNLLDLLIRLHIPYTGSGKLYDYSDSDVEGEMFSVFQTAPQVSSQSIPNGGTTVAITFSRATFDTVDFNDTNRYVDGFGYFCSKDMAINFKSRINATLTSLPVPGTTQTSSLQIKVTANRIRLGVTTVLKTVTESIALDTLKQVDIETGYLYTLKDDLLYIKVEIFGGIGNNTGAAYTLSCNLTDSTLINGAVNWYGEGQMVDMATILPDVLQTSFLKSVFHMFNVVTITDSQRKIIYLNTKNGMYEDTSISFNLDKSKKATIYPPINKSYDVGFAEDSTDIQDDDNLSAYEYVIATADETEKLLNTLFSATKMSGYSLQYIPIIWSSEAGQESYGASILPDWDTKHNLRVLYYDDVQTGYWRWQVSGDYYGRSTMPSMISYNSSVNYNFKDIAGVDGLGKTYWLNTLNQLTQNKIITAYFDINNNQMQGIIDAELNRDLRSRLRFGNDYYEILSISKFNPRNRESTMIKMIKANNWSPIPATSPTFDSELITWDSNLLTFDNN